MTLILFWHEAEKQLLQTFLGYDLNLKDVSYLEGTIISIATLDARKATVVDSFVNRESRGRHR